MKNKFKLFGAMRSIAIIAIVAMIGFSIIACEEDETVTPDGALVYTLNDDDTGYIVGTTTVGVTKSLQGAIVIPATYNSKPVTEVERYGFRNHSDITSIELPASITKIDEYAFQGCSGLTTINIPSNVTLIYKYTFSGCRGLTEINIPADVTSIGEYAFSYCTSLTTVDLPSDLKSIGERAFQYCTSVTEITIPSGVTSVGSYAFQSWTASQTIDIVGKTNRAGTISAGWSSSWDSSCTAVVEYRL